MAQRSILPARAFTLIEVLVVIAIAALRPVPGRTLAGSARRTKRALGFTLVELLAVIGIIVLLMAFGLPALTSLGKAGGRKTGASAVMNALEHSRMLALSTNQATYIAFAGGSAPEDLRYRAYAIFRESPTDGALIPETAWKKLPTGVSFRVQSVLSPDDNKATRTFLFPGGASGPCHYLKFDPTGAVEEPVPPDPSPLSIAIFEGMIEGAASSPQERSTRGTEIAAEEIRIARYTGRARLVLPQL